MSNRSTLLLLALGGLFYTVVGLPASSQEPSAVLGQMTTLERLRQQVFWPRQAFESSQNHVGTAACAECHSELVETQEKNGMATTLSVAKRTSPGLKQGSTFELGPYVYRILPDAEMIRFRVTDGESAYEAQLQWVFGSGSTGHTYMWQEEGVFYESRFSYFPKIQDFADTPGRLRGLPDSLDMATGHPLSAQAATGCFSCHATGLRSRKALDTKQLTPGITCEGCHGPGADHVALETAGIESSGSVFQPADLSPDASLDFCGACHGTFWDIENGPSAAQATVRSPGYRLVKSSCWSATRDVRLTCTACHDPHQPLEHEARSYDAACLACHSANPQGADSPATAPSPDGKALQPCPVSTQQCTNCHMPKVELPELQVQSTDHWIRVVREVGSSS